MDETQFFDQVPSREFLKRNIAMAESYNMDLSQRFKGDQSRDFYLGMIAASRVIISVLEKHPEDTADFILYFGINAGIIAQKK